MTRNDSCRQGRARVCEASNTMDEPMDEGNDRATDLLERLTDMGCVRHGRWLRRSHSVTLIRMGGGGIACMGVGMGIISCGVVRTPRYQSIAV
jgi:hypothetical protein